MSSAADSKLAKVYKAGQKLLAWIVAVVGGDSVTTNRCSGWGH